MADAPQHVVELLLHNELVPVLRGGVPIADMPVDLPVEVVLHRRNETQTEESSSSSQNELAHLNCVVAYLVDAN